MRPQVKRQIHIAIVILLVVGTLAFMYALRSVFNPFLLALALAYILNPFVSALERRRFPRKLAVGVVFLLLILLLLASAVLIVPYVAHEARLWKIDLLGEPFEDLNGNGLWDDGIAPEPFVDANGNQRWDPGESWEDLNGDQVYTPRMPAEPFQDINRNGGYDIGYAAALVKRLRGEDPILFRIRSLLSRFVPEEKIDTMLREAMASLRENAVRISHSLATWLAAGGAILWSESWRGVAWLWDLLLLLLLTPIYLAFLLYSLPRGWELFVRYIPIRIRPRLLSILQEIDLVIAAFFRGRLLVCLAIALFTAIGFRLCGVKFGVLFGILIGVLSLIPFLNLLAFLPALLACWMDDFSWGGYLAVIAVYLVGQGLDPLLTTWILGKDLQLHPVTILLSLFVCASLFGFFGMLLAVPIVATAKILAKELLLPSLEALSQEEGKIEPPPSAGG